MSTFRFSIEEVKRLVKKNNKGKGFRLDAVHDDGVYLMAKGQGRPSGGIIIHAFGCSDFQGGDDWHIGFDIPNDVCDYILQQKGDVRVTVNSRNSNISFYKTAKKSIFHYPDKLGLLRHKPKPFRIEF